MDAIMSVLACCCPSFAGSTGQFHINNTPDNDTANEFVEILLAAEKPGKNLNDKLDNLVGAAGWNWGENLAKTILAKLERAIAIGAQMAPPMREALEKSIAEAVGFAKDHPVYTTLIAIGVLAILCPWVLEALGFGELGPIAGSFAAAWQRTYAGYVPRGAFFGFLQRLGMIWRRYPKA